MFGVAQVGDEAVAMFSSDLLSAAGVASGRTGELSGKFRGWLQIGSKLTLLGKFYCFHANASAVSSRELSPVMCRQLRNISRLTSDRRLFSQLSCLKSELYREVILSFTKRNL